MSVEKCWRPNRLLSAVGPRVREPQPFPPRDGPCPPARYCARDHEAVKGASEADARPTLSRSVGGPGPRAPTPRQGPVPIAAVRARSARRETGVWPARREVEYDTATAASAAVEPG